MNSPDEERTLILAPTGRDAPLTRDLLADADLPAKVCDSMETMCREARLGAGVLLIAEEVLRPEAVQLLAGLLADQPTWSDLPIVVFTGKGATIQAQPPTISLLAPLGNVVVLNRPLAPITMLSTVRSALRARRRQYHAREELLREQAAVQARDQFLAMLGHELRNPLGVILLAAELLGRGGGSPLTQAEVITRQGRTLARMVDDLLDVSRVTSGKVLLKKERLNIGALVERAVDTCRQRVGEQQLTVEIAPEARGAMVHGDPMRLEQIVVNLVNNAIKYTENKGRIQVRVGCSEAEVVLQVIDDGPGISRDMLSRVFELFAQVDNTLVRSQGGLGIGLTLVRSLTALHGGTVEAHSDGLGHGSEFRVRLPLLPAEPRPVSAGPVRHGAATSRTILVVEDNDDGRELMRLLLESFGHEVHTAIDGEAGLARALALRPDVMLVDIGLPGLTGYEVAERVRQALGGSVVLVALTGYGQPDDQDRARKAGFDVHLTKPVTAAHLRRILSECGEIS